MEKYKAMRWFHTRDKNGIKVEVAPGTDPGPVLAGVPKAQIDVLIANGSIVAVGAKTAAQPAVDVVPKPVVEPKK